MGIHVCVRWGGCNPEEVVSLTNKARRQLRKAGMVEDHDFQLISFELVHDCSKVNRL